MVFLEDEIHESVGVPLRLWCPQWAGFSLYAHLHIAMAIHQNCIYVSLPLLMLSAASSLGRLISAAVLCLPLSRFHESLLCDLNSLMVLRDNHAFQFVPIFLIVRLGVLA